MSPSHYCDECTDEPAKRKITPQMARVLRMDPKTRVCQSCFNTLSRRTEALK